MQGLADLCDTYTQLGKDLVARPAKYSLLKIYKRKLKLEWYPILKALDDVDGLSHEDKMLESRAYIRQAWHSVGAIGIGLNEDRERKEHSERKMKLCSWQDCQWHTVESPEPVKACTGCGETVRSSLRDDIRRLTLLIEILRNGLSVSVCTRFGFSHCITSF